MQKVEMNHGTVKEAVARIKSSESPIAVFASKHKNHVHHVFANTMETRVLIDKGNSGFVGVFSRLDDPVKVEKLLLKHVKQ